MNDKLADLQQLISLSRAMREQARTASWEAVTQLEQRRRELLGAFFLAPVEAGLARAVSEGIRSIMAIDQDIIALGCAEKLELRQLLRQIDQGKKAVKAYGS
jgi:Flagellar protein FliT